MNAIFFLALTLLKGGADTGFRRVLPEAYKPRLFHVQKQGRKITCTQVSLKRGNLKTGDVFIIDTGSTIYQVSSFEKPEVDFLIHFCLHLSSSKFTLILLYSIMERNAAMTRNSKQRKSVLVSSLHDKQLRLRLWKKTQHHLSTPPF